MPQPSVTGLSGNEIYCMQLKGLKPSGIVVGNSVQSMGFLGGLSTAFRGAVGGEIPAVTEMIHAGREADLIDSSKAGKTIVYCLKLSVLEEALAGFAELLGIQAKAPLGNLHAEATFSNAKESDESDF